MKPTYDNYSKITITLKAAVIPFVLVGVKSLFEHKLTWIPTELNTAALHLSATAAVILTDLGFNYLVCKINDWEIASRISTIDKNIKELEAYLVGQSDKSLITSINKQLVKMRKERIELIS